MLQIFSFRKLRIAALIALVVGPVAIGRSADTKETQSMPKPRGSATITGRVLYEDGQPAAGVAVLAKIQAGASIGLMRPLMSRITDQQGRESYGFTGQVPPQLERLGWARDMTAADGTYRLSGLTNAPYNIMVAPSRRTIADKPSDWVAAAASVAAQEEKTISAPDLVLTHGATIRGKVIDQTTGKPLKGIIVISHGPHRPLSSGQTLTAVTDGEGRYSMRVAPGTSYVGTNGVVTDARGYPEVHDWAMKMDNAL